MIYLLLAIVGYLFLQAKGSGVLSSFGGGFNVNVPPSAVQVPPSAVVAQQTQQTSQLASGGIKAIGAGLAAVGVVPIVGTAVAAVAGVIASGLIAASKKRAQQASTENQAVANAVPGWDQGAAQIANAYNNGSMTGEQAIAAVNLIMQLYFQEVSPQIQPGRNGCQSGSLTKAQADKIAPGQAQCGGSWGAACCVGYADLWNGANSMIWAINQTENNGAPALAAIPQVFASKYGGTNRAAYTLSFVRPA